ncbi:DUF3107 domain-containing protein [Arcanobacterium haemolyticum]|nr:DUF3107 domain-containing protein [Arcanobacterium haemolyticum]
MDINIGVRNVGRELTINVESTAEDIYSAVESAMESRKPLHLTDSQGRAVIVPADALGYVEIAAQQNRRVGFGFGD